MNAFILPYPAAAGVTRSLCRIVGVCCMFDYVYELYATAVFKDISVSSMKGGLLWGVLAVFARSSLPLYIPRGLTWILL